MDKIKVNQVVVVEGKYDVIKLNSIIDGLIIPLNGFSIFTDDEKKNLLKTLGEKNGIILLTDSDTAGFKIRNYIENICKKSNIINVYTPHIKGKESRKNNPSKEGLLGVEGIDKDILINNLLQAGVGQVSKENKDFNLTYTDLFDLKLSGTDNAFENRLKLCNKLNIPVKLSKKAFLEVLNRMVSYTEIEDILNDSTVLFWDFHGTLSVPDNQWTDAALMLVQENFPELNMTMDIIEEHLGGQCLPWWTYPDRDTRHLIENDGWWKSCEEEFLKMYIKCGLTKEQALKIIPGIRKYVIDYKNHILFDNAELVLKTLKERGYKNYLLSNNFPELTQIVKDLKIDTYFEGLVVSALVGYDKPRKEIFEYGVNLACEAKRYIMIGDNPVDDMQGAKEFGMETLFLDTRGHDVDNTNIDMRCKNIIDILDILK